MHSFHSNTVDYCSWLLAFTISPSCEVFILHSISRDGSMGWNIWAILHHVCMLRWMCADRPHSMHSILWNALEEYPRFTFILKANGGGRSFDRVIHFAKATTNMLQENDSTTICHRNGNLTKVSMVLCLVKYQKLSRLCERTYSFSGWEQRDSIWRYRRQNPNTGS